MGKFTTCDINKHKITQLILEKHVIKLHFIYHNNLMRINTYRLGSMTCIEDLKNIYYITLQHLDQQTYINNFKRFIYF
jgi:hypothetical protein